MKRRVLAALPPLLAYAALAGGLGQAPHAAALAGGLCAAAALLAASAPAAAPPAWLSAAAALGAAGLARLMGQWCAEPAYGFALAAGACAVGAALESAAPAPADESAALGWAGAAGLLAAALPALLLFLGLNTADPRRLIDPLERATLFLVVQPALLISAAAAALSRAARGLARPAGRIDLLVGPAAAVLGAALAAHAPPAAVFADAGGALAAAAALRARPWVPAARPLPARLLAAAAAAAVLLASSYPDPLRAIWTARLDAVDPGGRFLLVADDGAATYAAYEFSRGERLLLREGALQDDDGTAELLALRALVGQTPGIACSVLLARPPGPHTVRAALSTGCKVAFAHGSPAAAAAFDAVAGDVRPDHFARLPDGAAPASALLFLPNPLGASARRSLVDARALRVLRARLAPKAPAAVLIPPRAASRASVAAVKAAAAAAFGYARAAWLPDGSAVVVASPQPLTTDPEALFERLPLDVKILEPEGIKILRAGLNWESEPSPK